jgi:hypothetical protein
MKIAFDIGGVISRYPQQMIQFMRALTIGGIEVHIVTDIPYHAALWLCQVNRIEVPFNQIHSCDWAKDGDLCKTKKCEELGIDILIDDRPDYCAVGKFIGLVLSPRPTIPYYAPEWQSQSETETLA